MAASSEGSHEGWPKWQIGLAVAVPVAVAGGYLLYQRRQKTKRSDQTAASNSKTTSVKDGKLFSRNESEGYQAQKDEEKVLSLLERAQSEKNKGNKYFKGGRYDSAINCYTEAIKLCPPEDKADLATFYQNRAAAYEKLMNLKMVIEDCTEALKYNKKYIKCLMRRANAAEQLGDLTQALEDVTALCILEGFQNPKSLMTADRVLKELGQSKAKKAYANRTPSLPSQYFIRTYLKAFTQDPVLQDAKNLSKPASELNGETNIPDEDSPYYQALRHLNEEKYDDVISLCEKELANDHSCKCNEARLLRGTFYFLCGELDKAVADIEPLLEEDIDKKIKTNALIKKGSTLIQQGKSTEALDCFAKAVRLDPDNPDIYHHRGHLNIQLDRIDDAIRDLEFSASICPTFTASHVQKTFAEHRKSAEAIASSGAKLPLPQTVIDSYKNNVTMFPDSGDARALYAQALTDAGKFDEADREFEKAINLDPDNATAMVHRGLLQLQWKQNVDEAVNMIKKAIEIDSKCEYAYEVLGTIEVQRSNMERAMELFQKAIQLCKTESEMAHLYSLLDAAHAQLKVAKNLDIKLPSMGPPMG